MNLNRRGFLKGIIASTAASTALVQLASPEEVQALVVGEPAGLMVSGNASKSPLSARATYCTIDFADGQSVRFELLEITPGRLEQAEIEVTGSDDDYRTFIPSTTRKHTFEITVGGPVTFLPSNNKGVNDGHS